MITITSPLQHPARVRTLGRWSIICSLEDKEPTFRLIGQVVTGINESPLAPGTSVRFTTSSPIVKITGCLATTESGSQYYLLNASESYLNLLDRIGETYSLGAPITLAILEKIFALVDLSLVEAKIPLWPQIQ